MEEEKAAAYYDELTRKGEGAARFKQGLGFSTPTDNDVAPRAGSALPSSSSFLSNFVRASSPSKVSEFEKQAQLQSIQTKLKKKPISSSAEETKSSRVSEKSHRESSHKDRDRDSRRRERHSDRDRDARKRSRSRERYRERDRESRRRSRSREKHRDRDSERRRRRRSRSRSDSDGDRRQRRSLSPCERRSDKRSRSSSPHERRRSENNGSDIGDRRKASKTGKEKNVGVDYARLIEGYVKMSPAERVKAKMKFQLSETAEKDSAKGEGWERFEFDKDAPLDDEEIEATEDDANLVKHIGQSFRFSAVEARREEQIQAAHEEAMFGSSTLPPPTSTDSEPERESNEESNKKDLVSSLLSETVLAKQKGSWRDRVREA